MNDTEKINCPICGSSSYHVKFIGREMYNKIPGEFQIVKCTDCTFLYQNPRVPFELLGQYYPSDYIMNQFNDNHSKKLIDKYWSYRTHQTDKRKINIVNSAKKVNETYSILDIGCGNATFIRELSRRYNAEVIGIDLSDKWNNFSKKSTEVTILNSTLKDFKTDKKFDLITMWSYLEHDSFLNETLIKIKQLLKKEGLLIIEVPNARSILAKLFKNKWSYTDVPRHLYQFTPFTLNKILNKHGFSIKKSIFKGAFGSSYIEYISTLALVFNKGHLLVKTPIYLLIPIIIAEILFIPFTILTEHTILNRRFSGLLTVFVEVNDI